MKKIILGSVNNAVEILSKTEYPVAIFEIIKTSGENEIIYVPKCNFAEGFQEDKNGFIHLESLLGKVKMFNKNVVRSYDRSEEHTSELQSRQYLVCRLLLEK